MQNFRPATLLTAAPLSLVLAISSAGQAADGSPSLAPACLSDASAAVAGQPPISTPCTPDTARVPGEAAQTEAGQAQGSKSIVLDEVGRIELSGQLLSVELKSAALSEVLRGVASLAGFQIEAADRAESVAISARFDHLPLDEGLRRLSRDISHITVWSDGAVEDRRIEKLIVLSVKSGVDTDGAGGRPTARSDEPSQLDVAGIELPDELELQEIMENLQEQMRAAGIEAPPMDAQAAEMMRRIEQDAERVLLEAGVPDEIFQQIAPHLQNIPQLDDTLIQPQRR